MMRSWRTGASASGERRGRIAIAAACLVGALFVPQPGWSGDQPYNVPAGTTVTVSTPITDATAPPPPTTVEKNEGGALILDAVNTYTGGTLVNGGTLAIGPGGSITTSSGVELTAAGTVFDISTGGSQTIADLSAVAGSTVALGANMLTVGTANSTVLAGVIADGGIGGGAGGSLVKQGIGTLTLTGANTYTGTTTINNGTLALGAGGSIASSSVVDLSTFDATFDISAAGNQTIKDLSGASGTVALGGNTLTVGTADSTDFAGSITDGGVGGGAGGSLVKQGSGTLSLSGFSTYTGATTITAGTLALTGDGSISSSSGVNLAASGTTFDISGLAGFATILGLSGVSGSTVNLGNSLLFIEPTGTSTFAGSITGGSSSELIFEGTGTQILSGANTMSGPVFIDSGALSMGAGGSIASASEIFVESGAVFDISNGGNQTIQNLGGETGANVTLGANTLTVSESSGSSTYSGVISGAGGLTVQGPGTLFLTGTNTYTGPTTINSGTLALFSGGSIAASSGVDLAGAGATFDISVGSNTQTIKDLSGVSGSTLALGGNALVFGTADSTDFAGSITGFGQLTKQGAGTFTLSGNSSDFFGTTLVTGGILQVGPISAPNAILGGSVTVENDAAVVGFGAIGGSLANPSGIVVPFSSTSKSMTVGGNYTQGGAGTLAIGLTSSGHSELLVNGSANLAGTLYADFAPGAYTPLSRATVLSAAGGVSGTFSQFTGVLPLLPVSVLYLPNAVELQLGGFVGTTANETAVANVLNAAFPTATYPNAITDFAKVLIAGVNLPAAEMQQALSSFGGQIYGNLGEVSLQDRRLFLGAMDERMRIIAGDSPSAAILGSLPGGGIPGAWGSGANAIQLAALGNAIGDPIDDIIGPSAGASPPPAGGGTAVAQPGPVGVPPGGIADPVGMAVAASAQQAQTPVTTSGNVWARGFGQFGNINSGGGALGSNFSTGGGAIGADLLMTPQSLFGFAVGGGQSSVSLDTNPETGTISFVELGIYGAQKLGSGFALDGAAVYSHDYYDVSRGSYLPGFNRVATSNHDGNDEVADIGISHPYIAGGWEVTPRFGLSYYHIGQSNFSESGAESLDLAVSPNALDALFSRLSIAIARPMVFEGVEVVPELRAAWFHNFLDQQGQFNAAFIGTGTPGFTETGVPVGPDGGDLGLGVNFAIAQTMLPAHVAGFLQYDATLASHEVASTVAVGLRVKW
jgi:fibronectin-binding autotransporter adhesin